MVGGSIILFILLGAGHTVLALNGVIESPLLPSIPFQLLVLALGYELGSDILRADRLARDLHDSERRLSLAASAGGTVLWEWRDGQAVISRLPELHFLAEKDGKPVAIQHHIGRRPIMAFGNYGEDYTIRSAANYIGIWRISVPRRLVDSPVTLPVGEAASGFVQPIDRHRSIGGGFQLLPICKLGVLLTHLLFLSRCSR